MKIKKAVINKLGDIVAIVKVLENVHSVRVCHDTTPDGTPVNSVGCRVTASKKLINSRQAEEAQYACTAKELPCGTFLLII